MHALERKKHAIAPDNSWSERSPKTLRYALSNADELHRLEWDMSPREKEAIESKSSENMKMWIATLDKAKIFTQMMMRKAKRLQPIITEYINVL